MKVCAHLNTAVADGIGNILKIIYREFLWNYVDDFIAGRDVGAVLICHKTINLCLRNFIIQRLAYNISTGLQAFNMVACNAYIYLAHLEVWIGCITIFQRRFYGFNGKVNI